MELPESRSLWRNRNFILLLSGQFVSWVGTEISSIVIPLIVLTLTGSPQQAGVIAGVRGLVYILLSIPAGVLIDRWDRRVVMVIANFGSGIAVGTIFIGLLLHSLSITLLYIAGVIEGAFFVFANLARISAVQQVVPRPQLPAAMSRISVSDYSSNLLGPALGGTIYQILGGAFAILTDSVSYFVNAISVFFIKGSLKVIREKSDSSYREIQQGIGWLWNQKVVRFLNLLTAGGTSVTAGLYLLIIIIAKSYNATPVMIGIVLAVGAAGGVVGSMVAEKIHSRLSFYTILKITTTLSFFVFILYFYASNIILLAIVTFLLNVIIPLYEVTAGAYSASVIPDEIRGRVTSLTRLVVLGSYSFGFFAMGTMLEHYGVNASIGIFAGVLLFLSIITAFNTSLKHVNQANQ